LQCQLFLMFDVQLKLIFRFFDLAGTYPGFQI